MLKEMVRNGFAKYKCADLVSSCEEPFINIVCCPFAKKCIDKVNSCL